jgi:hypothetical protein
MWLLVASWGHCPGWVSTGWVSTGEEWGTQSRMADLPQALDLSFWKVIFTLGLWDLFAVRSQLHQDPWQCLQGPFAVWVEDILAVCW